MYTSNMDMLDNKPTYFFFVSQNVYLEIPSSLAHSEDCASKRRVAEYRYKIMRHLANTCKEMRGDSSDIMLNRYETLPELSLNNMVIDKRRNYLYTALLGAFGTKWSKLMVSVNKVDGEDDNLVKMSKFVQTAEGREFLDHSKNLFKFYFVRNPLDRVISGYYYYFVDMGYAKKYLDGVALQELAAINQLDPVKISQISFEQYLNWIIHGASALKHFGVQSDVIRPCDVKYTLNGIFEILTMERLVVSNHVLDLKTPRSEFTTVRDLPYLTQEARTLVNSVNPEVMEKFYDKYSADYQLWNYSRPGHWFYPYPAFVKHMRLPNPNMQGNDFPKVKDIKEEDLVMLEELRGEEKRVGKRDEEEESRESTSRGIVKTVWVVVLVFVLFWFL